MRTENSVIKRSRKLVIICGGAAVLLMGAVGQPGMTAYAAGPGTQTQVQQQQATQSPRWEGSGDVWKVKNANGNGYLTNTWFQDEVTGHWYMIGAGDGTQMYAGLVTDQSTGKTYYLNSQHDGTYGRMVTTDGAYTINGKTVYLQFDQNHTGTYGAIISGLTEIRSAGVHESTFAAIPMDNQQTSNSGSTQGPSQQQQNNTQTGGSQEDVYAKIDAILKGGTEIRGFGNNAPNLKN